MAQAVVWLSSIAAATERLACENVACGVASFTGAPGEAVPVGAAHNWKSDRAKLPFAARPGPLFGNDASAKASMRTPVMPRVFVGTTNVYTSCEAFAPDTRYEPSSRRSNLALPVDFVLCGS